MALFSKKGFCVQPFKCGPDYIDTKFHTAVCHRPSINLDTFMATTTHVKELFCHLGFGSELSSKKDRRVGELFRQVQPHDLLKFGIIPELVGRLPVITSLHDLSPEDLVRILTEPKNALCKQYKQMLSYDGVELEFEPAALTAVAQTAVERKIGARGLRAVMEGILTPVMYEIPSDKTITKVVVTEDAVRGVGKPLLERSEKPKRLAAP